MTLRASLAARVSSGLRWSLIGCVLAWALVGCDDPNEAFSGRWGPPQEQLSGASASIDLSAGAVWPQLHLGHYGQEVAGIVTFHTTELVTSREPTCACAFVEHQYLNLDAQRLVFTTRCASVELDWNLVIAEDEEGATFLEGTVHRLEIPDDVQSVRLERLAETVDPFAPFCEESAP